MREIKFRAWDKNRKIMLYNEPEINPQNCGRLIYCDMETIAIGLDGTIYLLDECGQYEYPESIGEQYELMQFIGLRDKAGKEVYEGDLVKDDQGRILEVVWNSALGMPGWWFVELKDGDKWYAEKVNLAHIEVVGNIYEGYHPCPSAFSPTP